MASLFKIWYKILRGTLQSCSIKTTSENQNWTLYLYHREKQYINLSNVILCSLLCYFYFLHFHLIIDISNLWKLIVVFLCMGFFPKCKIISCVTKSVYLSLKSLLFVNFVAVHLKHQWGWRQQEVYFWPSFCCCFLWQVHVRITLLLFLCESFERSPHCPKSVHQPCMCCVFISVVLSSQRCVTYTHRETCGLKGSSIVFSCFYPKKNQAVSVSGWSKKLNPNMERKPLKQLPEYSFRAHYYKNGDNDCTVKLTDLQKTDASIYYFEYTFRNDAGDNVTCEGFPGVRLHIFESPVIILVEKLVRGQEVPVADRTVMEGQRIKLTCFPTCAANLNSNPGYIWYKNRVQLNGSRANSPFLSLDPITDEDTGSYVCAMISYKAFPSSAVQLTVQRRPRNTVVSEIPVGGLKNDCVPTQTPGSDAHNFTDQIFNNYQTPKDKSMFTLSIILVASVSLGWVMAIVVAIIVIRMKKKKKRRRRKCTGSVPRPPNPNNDSYMALDIKSMSAEYDTLNTVRSCSAADTVYENLPTSPPPHTTT